MVTYRYGPWIEPPPFEQEMRLGGDLAGTGTYPPFSTGIRMWGNVSVGVEADVSLDPAAEEPDTNKSAEAWNALPLDTPMTRSLGGVSQEETHLRYTSSHGWFIGPPGRYIQQDHWDWNILPRRLDYDAGSIGYPRAEDWPPGAVGYRYEETVMPRVFSIEVDPLDSLGQVGGNADLFQALMTPPLPEGGADMKSMTRNQLYGQQDVTGGYAFDASEVALVQSAINDVEAGTPVAVDDPRWPQMALAYVGPWPGELPEVFNKASVVAPSPEWIWFPNVTLVFRVWFTLPRYRFMFEGSPRVPRRIFPRDDGLTGGARRVWPPSKSHQWGNRVDGSGYL